MGEALGEVLGRVEDGAVLEDMATGRRDEEEPG